MSVMSALCAAVGRKGGQQPRRCMRMGVVAGRVLLVLALLVLVQLLVLVLEL